MSTAEQRKRFKDHHNRVQAAHKKWADEGWPRPPPNFERIPDDLRSLACGAKTKAGTPCKLTSIYLNGRCKWHGGLSTGAKTAEGKRRSALNGLCPKKSELIRPDKS